MKENKTGWSDFVKNYFNFKSAKKETTDNNNFNTKFDSFEKSFYHQNEIEAKEPIIPDTEEALDTKETLIDEIKDPLQESMYDGFNEEAVYDVADIPLPPESFKEIVSKYIDPEPLVAEENWPDNMVDEITEDELKEFKELNGITDTDEEEILSGNKEKMPEKPIETKVKSVKVSKSKTQKTLKTEKPEKKSSRQTKKK